MFVHPQHLRMILIETKSMSSSQKKSSRMVEASGSGHFVDAAREAG